jgi:hypothetical protein
MMGIGLVVCPGCAPALEYDIELANDTGAPIDDAHVVFEGFQSVGGSIPPAISKVHMAVTHEMPDTVEVQWRPFETPEASLRRVHVPIPPAVRDHLTFHDKLLFTIRRDGTVTVSREKTPYTR